MDKKLKNPKISLSDGQSNFVRTMVDSGSKKFTPPQPNTGTKEDPAQIEQLTQKLQDKWLRKR